MEIKSHNLKKQSPSTERCAIQHHSHHLVVPVGGLSIFKEGEMKLLITEYQATHGPRWQSRSITHKQINKS